jgi:hypothetical protein
MKIGRVLVAPGLTFKQVDLLLTRNRSDPIIVYG